MWLRVTQNEKPLMVNAERLVKIVASGAVDQRGAHLYTTETEYIEVDEGLIEVMHFLGFEQRE